MDMYKHLSQDDIHSFLLNAYFGAIDDPVLTAANSAYLDLNRTIEFKSSKISEERKASLRSEAVQLIVEGIRSLQKQTIKSQDTFDSWHDSLCLKLMNKYKEAGVPFHYGQSQKWVNMTMKYLSVINSNLTKAFFEFLHVPIDSVVFELSEELFGLEWPRYRWSRMDKSQYLEYQVNLRELILSNSNQAPLLWEFRSWSR